MISDIEKSKLEQLNDDIVLLGAIKKIFKDMAILPSDVSKTWDNERLGQNLKSTLIALELIEDGFKEIEKYKKVKIPERNNQNPAR